MGVICGVNCDGDCGYIQDDRIWNRYDYIGGVEMKKYRIHPFKLYSPRDVERRIGVERERIIAFLDKKKTLGRRMGKFWFIRGSEIIQIRKALEGNKRIKLTLKGAKKNG